MACNKPIKAYATREGGVVFWERQDTTKIIHIACGQCMGCRIERARQWAVRIMHEAQLHDANSFVTLTYSDENLPGKSTLRYLDYQLFMKRLRKHMTGQNVRFFMCGEYGEETGRPHYHACLFGTAFHHDRYVWKKTKVGYQLYRSPTLEKLWPLGDSNIGELTFDSANYVAGYVTKKLTGDGEKNYYNIFDPETGEIHVRPKEFTRMSLKPGIGGEWLKLYWSDVKDGRVTINGREGSAPRYYRKYFKNTAMYEPMINNLKENIDKTDNTPARLAVKEQVAIARNKMFKREIGE